MVLRAPVWDRSLSTRHGEPRFGVDCMKLRHTPLYRRNVFSDLYFCPLFGCVPALGKFGNDEKSCKNDKKQPESIEKRSRDLRACELIQIRLIRPSRVRCAWSCHLTRPREQKKCTQHYRALTLICSLSSRVLLLFWCPGMSGCRCRVRRGTKPQN